MRHLSHHPMLSTCSSDTILRAIKKLTQDNISYTSDQVKTYGEIEKHCTHFYIRANRCSSLYDDLFSLRGWKTEEINGIQFELNSILVEKWEGKCYRLVIQRQKRMDGELDLWEGEYTSLSAINAENQQIAKQTPNFTPKDVKLGVFCIL